MENGAIPTVPSSQAALIITSQKVMESGLLIMEILLKEITLKPREQMLTKEMTLDLHGRPPQTLLSQLLNELKCVIIMLILHKAKIYIFLLFLIYTYLKALVFSLIIYELRINL